MWKKMVLVGGLLGSLVLGVGAAEPAAVIAMPDWCGTPPPAAGREMIKATIWGRLQEVDPGYADNSHHYLVVVVNGRKYTLDFGSRLDLWRQAEKLRNSPVIVEGELQSDRVLVTGLRANLFGECWKE